jgi:hypothetical protein
VGAITGLVGGKGGVNGTGFAGPNTANITDPVTAAQIASANSGVQNSMQSQQQLLTALQGQNGLTNQSQVYNQLQGIASGTGPNPALAQLNQTTGQNVSNQAALMAGQRGASSNAGLIARQAAQQGGNLQQQAVGQGATMQAQQQLNAINSAGGMANTQASNQIGQTNANTSAQQANQQALLNAQSQYNNAQVGGQSSVNSANAGMAEAQMQGQQGLIGGVMAAAPMIAMAAAAGGGMIQKYAEGGDASAFSGPQSRFGQFISNQGSVSAPSMAAPMGSPSGAGGQALLEGGKAAGKAVLDQSKKNKAANDASEPQNEQDWNEIDDIAKQDQVAQATAGPGTMMAGEPAVGMPAAAEGGEVSALVSPGEKYLDPNEVKAVAKGKASPAQVGKVVPGKPKYKGNNYANDVVPAKLKDGGIVIPNSIMQSKDPVNGAAQFVRDVLAKKKVKA